MSIDDINERLQDQGFRSVSARTYQHYHKLFRYGYENYVPINQLDVETLQDPVWEDSVRKRYAFRETHLEVEVRLLDGKTLLIFPGLAARVSDAMVVVRFSDSDAVGYFAAHRRRRRAILEIAFRDTGEVIAASLDSIYIEMQRDVAVVRAAIQDPLLIDGLGLREPLDERSLRVVIAARDATVFLGDVAAALYWIFRGIEAARLAADDLLLAVHPEGRFGLPPSRVRRMQLSSPLTIDIVSDAATIVIALGVVEALTTLRKNFFHPSKEVNPDSPGIDSERSPGVDAEASIAQRLRWETKRQQLRKTINKEPVRAQAIQALRSLLDEKNQAAVTADEDRIKRFESIIDGQIIPALQALLETVGDAAITFDAEAEDASGEDGAPS